MHGQIEELVTNYGRIDILWFDYAYDELRGEAWRATDLIRMVRRHQPDVIIDNRLETSGEGFGSLVTEQPAYYSGDFVSPEQILPPEGIRNVRGERVPWELCTTMNNNWGYNPYDTDYKPASMLIRKLVECVSKGGNMILNVGPDANGRFNAESCRLLDEIGAWMSVNSESIYGCGSADVPKPDWGWYTKKSGRIYAHILENPIGPLALTGLDAKRVGAVRRLADGSEVLRGESWITNAYENLAFVTLGTIPHFTYLLPDTTDMTINCIYVPLLTAASKTADELSIASVTRGIENPKPRTCLVKIQMRSADFLTMVFLRRFLPLRSCGRRWAYDRNAECVVFLP